MHGSARPNRGGLAGEYWTNGMVARLGRSGEASVVTGAEPQEVLRGQASQGSETRAIAVEHKGNGPRRVKEPDKAVARR